LLGQIFIFDELLKEKFLKVSSRCQYVTLSVYKKGFHITDHFYSNLSVAINHPTLTFPHNAHTRLQNLLELINGAAQVFRQARVANVDY
jgi:hypothetical protein